MSDTPLHHHHTPCTLSLISTSCHLDQWEASIFLPQPIRARSWVAKSPRRETEKYIFTGRLTRLCEHWNLWYIDDAETLNSIWNIICQHMLFKVGWGKFWMLWIMTIQHVRDCCDGHSLHMALLMVSQEVALSMLTMHYLHSIRHISPMQTPPLLSQCAWHPRTHADHVPSDEKGLWECLHFEDLYKSRRIYGRCSMS